MGRFKIEFYPRTNRYYVKYGWGYLEQEYFSGIVKAGFLNGICYAKACDTEDEAQNLIKLYKEQRFKENVRVRIVPKK